MMLYRHTDDYTDSLCLRRYRRGDIYRVYVEATQKIGKGQSYNRTVIECIDREDMDRRIAELAHAAENEGFN